MMNRGGERAVDGSDTQCGLTNHLLTRLSDRRAGARAAAEASTRNAGGPNTPLRQSTACQSARRTIIDTAEMVTGMGSPLFDRYLPRFGSRRSEQAFQAITAEW